MDDPPVVSRDAWLAARKELLAKEKEFTRQRDALSADRHRLHGISAFLRRGDRVFHTYSGCARGTDLVAGTYNWLDLTARGRQEDWEQPPGRSDSPLMGWLRHHDKYGA